MIPHGDLDVLYLASAALGVLAFIFAVNLWRKTKQENRRGDEEQRVRDREQQIRDLADEHRADGSWAGYVRDPADHLIGSSAFRSVPTSVALSDPDPARRARRSVRNYLWRQYRP